MLTKNHKGDACKGPNKCSSHKYLKCSFILVISFKLKIANQTNKSPNRGTGHKEEA